MQTILKAGFMIFQNVRCEAAAKDEKQKGSTEQLLFSWTIFNEKSTRTKLQELTHSVPASPGKSGVEIKACFADLRNCNHPILEQPEMTSF